jgi:hypothetical protein
VASSPALRRACRRSALPENTLSSHQTASPAEFRPYRRFVSWFVLLFVSVGVAYLLVSVAVSIYQRRKAAPKGAPVSGEITEREVRGCFDELAEVADGLQKHLENFHHLLGGYDPAEAQRWGDEAAVWRRQWRVLGDRCRFGRLRPERWRKEYDDMAGVYEDLGETQKSYTDELTRFGREQAPRLDRVRTKVRRIGERLANAGTSTGEKR